MIINTFLCAIESTMYNFTQISDFLTPRTFRGHISCFDRKIVHLHTLKETWKIGSNIPIYIISDVTKATGHDFSFTPNCAIYARLGPSDTSWNIICIYRYYSLCLDENFAPIIPEFKRCRWRWCRANSHKKIFLKENLTNFSIL